MGEEARDSSLETVSVIVRSYERRDALLQLVEVLRDQDYPSFEIVVLEQSVDPDLVRELESLDDRRLRVIATSPKNPPAARNEAIRHATGQILILIDDDDLPIGRDWIRKHVENYSNPLCMGVVGRLIRDPKATVAPRFPWLVRFFAMKHTLFLDCRALAHNTLRKENIDFLIGSNASLRRALLDRIGGWDEGIPMNEEQSFSFKFQRAKKTGEHLAFDPCPVIWRRTDVPGGLNRRFGDDWFLRELDATVFYYRHVVAHYFPWRYRIFYPLFLMRAFQKVAFWVWDGDNAHRGVKARLSATFLLLARLPEVLLRSRFPATGVRRIPTWE